MFSLRMSLSVASDKFDRAASLFLKMISYTDTVPQVFYLIIILFNS